MFPYINVRNNKQMKKKFQFRYFDKFEELELFANSQDVTIVQVMPMPEPTFYKYVVFYYVNLDAKN